MYKSDTTKFKATSQSSTVIISCQLQEFSQSNLVKPTSKSDLCLHFTTKWQVLWARRWSEFNLYCSAVDSLSCYRFSHPLEMKNPKAATSAPCCQRKPSLFFLSLPQSSLLSSPLDSLNVSHYQLCHLICLRAVKEIEKQNRRLDEEGKGGGRTGEIKLGQTFSLEQRTERKRYRLFCIYFNWKTYGSF